MYLILYDGHFGIEKKVYTDLCIFCTWMVLKQLMQIYETRIRCEKLELLLTCHSCLSS